MKPRACSMCIHRVSSISEVLAYTGLLRQGGVGSVTLLLCLRTRIYTHVDA